MNNYVVLQQSVLLAATGDVGDTHIGFLEPILKRCSAQHLENIEDGTR